MRKNIRKHPHSSQPERTPPSLPPSTEVQVPPLKDWSTIPDISDPREAFYQRLSGPVHLCLKCGGVLHQQYKTYVIGNYEGGEELESIITGGTFGWFCATCPVMVINLPELHEFLKRLPPDLEIGSNAIVLGIVNHAAIPVPKRAMPVGTPQNPIPLCVFTNLPSLPPKSKVF